MIYIDHDAALRIAKQITLTTSSTNKLNLRLIRASDYIQRFRNIEFRYKLDFRHIVPDALSRLAYTQTRKNESEGELNALWAHAHVATVLVEMSPELKAKILQGYQDNKSYTRVLKVLDANDNADEDVVNLPFFRGEDGLIWHIENVTSDRSFVPERLCVPKSCVQEFFDIVHDKNGHIERDKCHEIISRQ